MKKKTVSIGSIFKTIFFVITIPLLIIACIIIYALVLYFKNIELKRNPEENRTEIEKNNEKFKSIKKNFVKIGGIIFAVVIMVTIILSNFI